MKSSISCFVLISLLLLEYIGAQNTQTTTQYFNAEALLGITAEANEGFPNRGLTNGLFFNYGFSSQHKTAEWAKRLKFPVTGISFGYLNFGNNEKLGQAFTLSPFLKVPLFKKKTNKYDMLVGFGASYFNKIYDVNTNRLNRGVSTKLNWTYRAFVYYKIVQKEQLKLQLSLGYIHNSNGHTRLPNQGLNSFLGGVSAVFGRQPEKDISEIVNTVKSSQLFISARFGLGQNVFSEIFNDRKEVYNYGVSVGKIYHKTFKIGVGLNYRFYESYYDYIVNDGPLIQEPEYVKFKKHPKRYASNLEFFGNAELLLSHIAIGFGLGITLYKPFYEVEWKDSQGVFYQMEDDNGDLVTLNTIEPLSDYYKIKKTITSRLGLKYYVINMDKAPKHNVFLAAHINANLGQADFSELSLGYVYSFKFKIKE